jgi:hypothetical protein
MASCPLGHVMDFTSFAREALKRDLGDCGGTIRRGEAHFRCNPCDYDVCNETHELPRRPARPGVTNRGGQARFRQLSWRLHHRQHRRSASLRSRPRPPSSKRSSGRPVQLAHGARDPRAGGVPTRHTHKWDGLPTLPTHEVYYLTQVHTHKHKPHGLRGSRPGPQGAHAPAPSSPK